MAPIIYLVRHAESTHNVSKDFSLRDPPLTDLGRTQASALVRNFPDPASIAVVLTSPLTRTLETTLAAFGHILDKKYVGEAGAADGGARLIIDPDLQERSDLPCDTGSAQADLEARFLGLDFDVLGADWHVKAGAYAADDKAVEARAERVRRRLLDLARELDQGDGTQRQDIVVVTHGVFMKFLSDDQLIDLPKAGWEAYTVISGSDGRVILGHID
jgi:broad specificity phosphatase PhoE